MKWYIKVLKEYSHETAISVCVILSVLFIMAIFQLTSGHTFVWHSIAPIERPDIFSRFIYSALTYFSLGAFLYYIRFYQLLSWIFGRDRRGYNDMKGIVWFGLIWIMYASIVPAAVNVLNSVVSFFYNVLVLMTYVSPVALVILLIVIACIIYRRGQSPHSR
jgi:hypothetical protein